MKYILLKKRKEYIYSGDIENDNLCIVKYFGYIKILK